MRNPDRPVEASMVEPEDNPSERKRLAKITDLEKWEIKQVSCPHIAVKVLILPRGGSSVAFLLTIEIKTFVVRFR